MDMGSILRIILGSILNNKSNAYVHYEGPLISLILTVAHIRII